MQELSSSFCGFADKQSLPVSCPAQNQDIVHISRLDELQQFALKIARFIGRSIRTRRSPRRKFTRVSNSNICLAWKQSVSSPGKRGYRKSWSRCPRYRRGALSWNWTMGQRASGEFLAHENVWESQISRFANRISRGAKLSLLVGDGQLFEIGRSIFASPAGPFF